MLFKFREIPDGAELAYPDSYQRTTSKEQRVLDCVDNFRRQYIYIYPDRRPLMLAPLNECDVQVFRSPAGSSDRPNRNITGNLGYYSQTLS